MQSSMRAIASLLIASLISLHVSALEAAAQQTVEQQATVQRAVQSADSPALTRQYVSQLPIGTVVKIDLVSGEKLTATLMIVNQADVVVKPKTRVAEAARTLPYESILRIEPIGRRRTARFFGRDDPMIRIERVFPEASRRISDGRAATVQRE